MVAAAGGEINRPRRASCRRRGGRMAEASLTLRARTGWPTAAVGHGRTVSRHVPPHTATDTTIYHAPCSMLRQLSTRRRYPHHKIIFNILVRPSASRRRGNDEMPRGLNFDMRRRRNLRPQRLFLGLACHRRCESRHACGMPERNGNQYGHQWQAHHVKP